MGMILWIEVIKLMLSLIVKRLGQSIFVIFGLMTVTFFLIQLAPGGPFDEERPLPPQAKAALEAHYGLSDPLWVQYGQYVKNILKGDLGPSYSHPGYGVSELIAQSFPVSVELGLLAWLLSWLVGIPAGVLSAARRSTWWDKLGLSLSTVILCIPSFMLGPLLMLGLAVGLGIGNVCGWYTWEDRILPVLTIGIIHSAYVFRLVRMGMGEVLDQDFIRMARAKGCSEARVLFVHGLRGGLLGVTSAVGAQLAGLISGSFVVETIFHIPGLGKHFVQGAFNRDYTLILGTTLLYGVMILAGNLLSDVLQVALNPRLRRA
jgi:oligopeptide transport system permease protein